MNAPEKFDFHCHSTVSDGLLPPAEVVQRAASNGVDLLALTDHDDVAGYAEARQAASGCGIELVSGVEVSIEWGGVSVHIVGLGIAVDSPPLLAGLSAIRNGRKTRAERMAKELEKLGLKDVLSHVLALSGNPNLVSRAHFARYLVDIGHCKDVPSVFKRYLVPGKPGYVDHRWATLTDALSWILAAGGIAVIAHPARDKFSHSKMSQLLDEFKALGGMAVEVLSGSHTPDDARHFAQLARKYELYASSGSDFHGPDESYMDLGKLPPLATDLQPVWLALNEHRSRAH